MDRHGTDNLRLSKLAAGSYDLIQNGAITASLMRTAKSSYDRWTAELLINLPPQERLLPSTAPEHELATLEEARRWL
jgi:hypothetical protein